MKKYLYGILFLFSIQLQVFAQRLPDVTTEISPSNLDAFLREQFAKQQALLLSKSKELNVPIRETLSNGTIREMVAISPTGMPIYVHTGNNLDAAKTISTNKVWAGGSSGLSLSGSGMTNRLGVWDGGAVRTTHQEFQSRATQVDAPSSYSDHATHVAGTMAAGGVVANAKGMSWQAPIKCYDWNSDESEMSSAAAAGMLVSNHSYSQISGWQYNSSLARWEFWGDPSVSTIEDYKYGFYDYISSNWDQIALTYPNYLPFVAAGNDRGEPGTIPSTFYIRNTSGSWVLGNSSNPPLAVGPYDCISGGPANAKNVLTVGAVNKITTGWTKSSDVVMSSFSGWGPTDDGRIKPDVVANGVAVYSSISTSNTAYTSLNGTSMATPNASGSALLIQQHYFNLKAAFMRASTLKGLIIHTADEAGANVGPDYTYGWGLMNTAKATTVITDTLKNAIFQNTHSSLGTYSYTFFSDGTTPIRATICWTDRPGTTPNIAIDPVNRMLVNDLDVRIKRNSDNQLFLPYILNKNTPSAAATTGDNNIDNVEQVYIAAPTAGTYTVTITGKGSMVGSTQPYALIVSGITPKPTAAFTTASRVVCSARAITFNDQSSGATSRMWYFTGGTPATSTALNPSVTYAVPGVYPVALRISSATGYDSTYKNDYITVGGLALPLVENFEPSSSTRSLWTIENPNSDTTFRYWTIGGTTPGNTALGINNYDYPTNFLLDRILIPVLDLRGYQNAKLEFQHAYTRYDNSPADSLIIHVSTNCGTSYTRIAAFGENGNGTFATAPDSTYMSSNRFIPSTTADWCGVGAGAACLSVSLNSFVGNANVRIRIEQKSQSGNNLFIDNVSITGTPAVPTANFYALTKTVCAGYELQLLDSSLGKPDQWNWTFQDAEQTTSNLKNPKVKFLSAGTKAITLVVNNVSGKDSITKVAYITVLPSPAAPAVTSSKGILLCDGDSTLFQSNATVGTFVWYKNNLPFSTTLTSFQAKDEALYYQRVQGANGCWTKSTEFNLVTGTTPAKPIITKDLTGNVFCEGGVFNLFSSAVNNNQWMVNDTLFDGQTSNKLTYNNAGKFVVRVSDKGCYSYSDSLVLTQLPRPQTSEISGQAWAIKGDTAVFSVIPGAAGSIFNWTLTGGSVKTGATTSQVTIQFNSVASALVNVQENGSNGCKGLLKSININLVNTSVNNVSKEWELQIFPNPAKDILHIESKTLLEADLTVKVTELSGKQILMQQGNQSVDVSISSLAPGIYLVNIQSGDKVQTRYFVKE
jgi:PKD repeat protein